MKHLAKLVIVSILILGASVAQAQKFGHINFEELIESMPEKQKALDSLQKEYNEVKNLIEEMSVEFNKKLMNAQNSYETMSKTSQEMLERELQESQARIQQFQTTAEERLMKRREELLNPIIDKAEVAVKKVAEREGFMYIYDVSKGSQVLYYSSKSIDVMPLVKKELGILK
ncbi:MAG: periplasmic chaperone [Bacteroidetes bacterium ADurb.Bin217]|nr:MAG: periplasmic chaperone [Bacteroidetes bacterium ADurb.Bin217]